MPKYLFFGAIFLISSVFVPSFADARGGPKADVARLQRSYAANEWHMKRFILEHLSLEQQYASDPKNPEFVKRAQSIKMQIDVLSQENERILDTLDESGRRR